VREHAKFIHSSYVIAEDLGKKVTINELDYTIVGLWDIIGFKRNILVKEVGKETSYAFADSKVIAEALGFTNYRNLVTGVQVPYDMAAEFRIKKSQHKSMLIAQEALEVQEALDKENAKAKIADELFESIDDESDEDFLVDEDDKEDDKDLFEEDLEVNPEDEDEDIDPLVKALRQSDDNEDYYNED
jgi:hypothetical protein